MEKNQIKFDIENGPVFFSDEIGVIHNPVKFIIDFRNTTPRIDIRSKEFQPLVVKHNVVVMDTFTAKNFLDALKKNLETYEKKFGKITEPKEIAKAKRGAKKKKSTKADVPSYFG